MLQQVVMSFYLPDKYQENPPEPTGEGVYTESRDEMKVYVRTFGGRAYGKDWTREIDNLKNDLKKVCIMLIIFSAMCCQKIFCNLNVLIILLKYFVILINFLSN